MLMTEIRKETVGEQPTSVGPALELLAESAKAVLGYDVLAKKMESVAIVPETTCLRMTLQSLGIEILVERDVARYQKERLIEQTTELMRKWMEDVAKHSMEEFRRGGMNQFSGPDWRMVKISEYRQPVPEHILAKAVEVKEKMPECEIYIEHLSDHPDPFLVVGAAAAKYSWYKPDEHYYLAAWAEPKFEGRLDSGEAGTEAIDDIPF
jgi:hypothetical protein